MISKRVPIDIDAACQLVAKQNQLSTHWSEPKKFPVIKWEETLFFEDELLDWISKGKRKLYRKFNQKPKPASRKIHDSQI